MQNKDNPEEVAEGKILVAVGGANGLVFGRKDVDASTFRAHLEKHVLRLSRTTHQFGSPTYFGQSFQSVGRDNCPNHLPAELYEDLIPTWNVGYVPTWASPRGLVFIQDHVVAVRLELHKVPFQFAMCEWWFGDMLEDVINWVEHPLGIIDDEGSLTIDGLYYPVFTEHWPLPAMGELTPAIKALGALNALLTPSDDNALSGLLRSGEPYKTLAKQVINLLQFAQKELQR